MIRFGITPEINALATIVMAVSVDRAGDLAAAQPGHGRPMTARAGSRHRWRGQAFRHADGRRRRLAVDIRENEFFALLGPSGCGKTTLLGCSPGFETPNGGQHPARRRGHVARAAEPAAGQPDVPVLCAVPAHERARATSPMGWRWNGCRRPRSAARVDEMLATTRACRACRPQAGPAFRRAEAARRARPRAGQAAARAAARRAARRARQEAARARCSSS